MIRVLQGGEQKRKGLMKNEEEDSDRTEGWTSQVWVRGLFKKRAGLIFSLTHEKKFSEHFQKTAVLFLGLDL